jgi:hypothetical protein
MFKKLFLMGASPPHWPGAGPGLLASTPLTSQPLTQTVLKENENGH